jgi:hypothetical protein
MSRVYFLATVGQPVTVLSGIGSETFLDGNYYLVTGISDISAKVGLLESGEREPPASLRFEVISNVTRRHATKHNMLGGHVAVAQGTMVWAVANIEGPFPA